MNDTEKKKRKGCLKPSLILLLILAPILAFQVHRDREEQRNRPPEPPAVTATSEPVAPPVKAATQVPPKIGTPEYWRSRYEEEKSEAHSAFRQRRAPVIMQSGNTIRGTVTDISQEAGTVSLRNSKGAEIEISKSDLSAETRMAFFKDDYADLKAREIVRGEMAYLKKQEAERSQAEEQKNQAEAKRRHALDTGQKTITRVCTGALTKKLLDQYTGIHVSGDRVALEKILTAGVLTGQYRIFTKGEIVYVTDTAILSGLAEVRPEGSTIEYWIPMESLWDPK